MRNPKVQLHVANFGTIVLELDEPKAHRTVENFLQYVKSGFYNGLIFHRVIPNFMIQGGGFDANMQQKPNDRPRLTFEITGLKNTRGTVAMARTQDPHSATSQFFINVADNAFLDHTRPTQQGYGYAVFGKVVEGMDVVDKIAATAIKRRGFHDDVPVEEVVIEKAELLQG
jgi:peptidyl-prolyl cis-trans isomerase B (cyclophilin B)